MSDLARSLRRRPTDAERRLWRALRNRGLCGCKFRRQHPIGRYVADFVCLEHHLVVEVDGGQHAASIPLDTLRTRALAAQGFKVLRFWNHEVLTRADDVLEAVRLALLENPPSPPPSP